MMIVLVGVGKNIKNVMAPANKNFMDPDLIPKIGKYVFAVIGIGLLIGSFFIYRSVNKFVKVSMMTTGKVIAVETEKKTSYPVVEFQTPEGKVIEFRSDYGGNPSPFKEGEIVKVLYSPESPEEAKIDTFMGLWLGLLIVGPLGILFFVIGVGSILFGRW